MHTIEIVLIMLLAVVFSGYLVRALPVSVPLPLVQIALGAIIAGVFNEGITLDPEFFFLFFLPPLLFLDGWRIPKQGLFYDKGIILQLTIGLVIFTVLGAGLLIHWMIPAMPLPVAFALAAIVSPTDAVAVSAICARVPMPKRLMHILEGESLLNDASGLVCFRFAVAAVLTGGFSLASASLTFLWLAVGGLSIGVVVTLSISRLNQWISRKFGEEEGLPIMVSLLLPFASYLLAEYIHASGILAAVSAGITMSYVEFSGRALATTRIQRTVVWNTVQFALNGLMFILLGEQLPGILSNAVVSVSESGHFNPWWLLLYTLVINFVLAVLRFSWVWLSLRWNRYFALHRHHKEAYSPPWRLVLAMSLSGVRGAITLAGILTLPLTLQNGEAFPARDLAIFLATGVILFSLVSASLALPRLLRNIELPAEPESQKEEALARKCSAAAAIAAVEKAQRDLPQNPDSAQLVTDAASRVIAFYQARLDAQKTEIDAHRLCRADEYERALRLAAVRAERDEIFELGRKRSISEELSGKLIRNLDLLESHYTASV